MRVLPALAISVLGHGIAIGWLATHNIATPRVMPQLVIAPRVPVQPPARPAEVEPIAIEYIGASTGHGGGAGLAASGTEPTHRGEHGTGGHSNGPSHSDLMTMRRPVLNMGLSPEFWAQFYAKEVHAQPNPIEGERIGDDIAALEQDLHDPEWMRHASPDQLREAREALVAAQDARDAHELKQDGDGYKAEHPTWEGRVDPDGNVHFKDKPNWQQHGLTASFDATDALMREHGEDPYAAEKKKFLDDTREERYQIGKRYKHQELARSAELAQETLTWIWSQTTDTRERKDAVFELWDACAESGDDDLVAGGKAARAMIVGFIQAHLVGADAYTPAELTELNAHKASNETFAPYAD